MDGNHFDNLVRRFGQKTNRRALLRATAGAAATALGLGSVAKTRASFPNATYKLASCSGKQTPCGDECCPSGQQCCDGACCDGQCFGEELCCPNGRVVCNGACLPRGQCCTDADCKSDQKCGLETPHICACVPKYNCSTFYLECGELEDNCGNILDCGTCPEPGVCGGAGRDNRCGCANGGVLCEGKCLEPGQCCTDLDCFTVASGKCGAVEPHVCTCVYEGACEYAGFECGSIIDPCGNTVSCGECAAPLVCDTGEHINTCICPSDHIRCNGNCLEFGQCCENKDCPPGYECGVEAPNECACVPQYDCASFAFECGAFEDDCGNVLDCGTCPEPGVCGGAGVENRCGCANGGVLCDDVCLEPGQCCTDLDCSHIASGQCGAVEPHICTCVFEDPCGYAGFECGSVIDPCGATVDCGACPPGQMCKEGGDPYYQCVPDPGLNDLF